MGYLGSFAIDDTCTFYANSHTPATGAAVDADAAPGYRVYEDETGAPILTGTMALLDDANTTGFYSEQITLSAANGFEAGKSYCVRLTLVVGGVTGVQLERLQIGANGGVETALAAARTELGGVPAANASLVAKIEWIFMMLANPTRQTATAQTLRTRADSADVATAAASDDGTTTARGAFT